MSAPRPARAGGLAPFVAAGLALVFGTASGPAAQQLVRSEDAVVALFSLQTELDVDARVLKRMEVRLEENRRAREEARRHVAGLYVELDSLFDQYRTARDSGAEQADPTAERDGEGKTSLQRLEEQIDAKEQGLLAAERAETGIMDDGRRLRDDIRNLRERMQILAQQIDALRQSLPTQRETVTGVWDVTMLPSGDRGVFALFQSGTVVTGQYVLDGPFQGSLDGTLIDRKLLLHRIDARLGRSMDFTATLSSDGQALRGSWENYDLANGQARTGSWAARRRQPRAPGDESDQREDSP